MRSQKHLSVLAVLAPFVICALVFSPTLSGAFLSDDYAVLGALSDWSRQGHLLTALLSKFHSGLDSPSFYYRPLSFASLGINFTLAGANPLPWRLTNLALHLTNGALVFTVGRRFAMDCGGAPSILGPAIAATVFLLFPTGPEAVAWVSGRYDLLALAFMLATLALFLRAARWNDRWGIAALLTAACALASKESAALLPAAVLAIAIARRAARSGPATPGVFFAGVRDAAPWILLGFAYFGMRAVMFGNPFQVYAGTSPLDAMANGAWMHSMGSAGVWLDAVLPLPLARSVFLIAIALLLVLGATACWGRGSLRWAWLALAISALLSVVLLLPHLSALAANGEQGRLFYTTSALLALLIGLAVAAPASPVAADRKWMRATAIGAAVLLIAAELLLLRATVASWSEAGAQARALIVALPDAANEISADGYGIVLVPDHLRGVPFARNAQGGLIESPTQPHSLSSRLIVQVPADLRAWPANAQRGLVDALRRYPLSEVWTAIASGRAAGTALPTDYFCWTETPPQIARLGLSPGETKGEWLDAWRRALAASACREVAAELEAS